MKVNEKVCFLEKIKFVVFEDDRNIEDVILSWFIGYCDGYIFDFLEYGGVLCGNGWVKK